MVCPLRRRTPIGARTQLLTTRHAPALAPGLGDAGATRGGVAVGTCTLGGVFRFDPFDAYAEGLVTNPNVLVAGQIGRGKSALVKCLLSRAVVAGRRCVVVDPKGEYAAFAAALGAEPVALEPNGRVRLNPLAGDRDDPARAVLLAALLATSLERRLASAERAALDVALRSADDDPGQATLRGVLDHLLSPSPSSAALLGTTVAELAAEGRTAALELRRLVGGELRGMFDGPASPGADLSGDVVVLDVSGALRAGALPVVLCCAAAALEATRRAPRTARTILVLDEAWSLLADEGAARWLQAGFKLARARGIAHVLVLHRLSDLAAAGSDGSVTAAIAAGLLRDVETSVLFGQPPAEAAALEELLGLSGPERDVVARLPRGAALWRVGAARSVVRHAVAPAESAFIDTDAAMRG
ncbi:MAG TPA: ATP-binding protein [Acidimicrobiales bacterium]|nr:ATP-binding protein [Acidimicrobiales bacterium]